MELEDITRMINTNIKNSSIRIENLFKQPVKIAEVQMGSVLKETDIIRFEDAYGRIN